MTNLDSELEYKLKLKTESEYENLYQWSIDEVDEEGKVVGDKDLIPWNWDFYFKAKEISYLPKLEMENQDGSLFGDDEEKVEKEEFEVDDRDCITAELEPNEELLSFQMFGTKRLITDFSLSIYPSEDKEGGSLWACPEYTTEIDFDHHTAPDTIQISMFVKEKKFKKLVDLITAKSLNSLQLRIGGVSGFYSHWSPMISTTHVKVLTDQHELDIPDDCKIEPPRTGQVRHIGLFPKSTQKLIITQETVEDDENNWFDEAESDRPKTIAAEDLQEQTILELVFIQKMFQKFKKLLWGIIFLLGFIVLILLGV